MANAIEKVNTIAIASIEAINGKTDANIQELNALEFTGYTYGGITWSTDDNIPVGTASAGLSGKVGTVLLTMMGLASPVSYEHDGDAWSSSTATGGAMHDHGHAAGTQGAAVIYGGYTGSDDGDTTDEYNGTSWSNVNSMVQGSYGASGGGEIQSTCFITGGYTFNPTAYPITMTQTYDATTWTNESVASDGYGSGNAQNSGGGGLNACFKAVGTLEGYPYTTGSSLFNQSASSWTTKATVSKALVYTVTCSDGVRVYKIGGFGPPGGAYSGTNMNDTVESWVENSWTTESVLPVKTITAGMGSGGQQALGGAFQAGGAYWNGSSKVNASTQYYTAAAS